MEHVLEKILAKTYKYIPLANVKKMDTEQEKKQLKNCMRCHRTTDTLYQDYLCKECLIELLEEKRKLINMAHALQSQENNQNQYR